MTASTLPLIQRARDALRLVAGRYVEQPLGGLLARLGISPNVATLLGMILAGVAAYFAATARFPLAALFVFLGGLFDLVDGALARRAGLVTKKGAFLDSNADRVSEGAVLLGLLVYFVQPASLDTTAAVLCFVAFGGSLMVSYVRARAEGLGLGGESKFEGFFTRTERVAVVAIGLAVGQPLIVVWILAVGTPLSALQRFWSIWRSS